MKTNWKKYVTSGLMLGTAVLLTACGGGNSSDKQEDANASSNEEPKVEGKVKLWVDRDFIPAYKEIVADFEKEYPDVTVELTEGTSTDAQKDVSKDPKAAADVFMMPHDQLGQMAEAGLIYPNTKYADDVKGSNVESSIEGASWKGELYGYPYGVESQFLYYNKSKLSEDDVKTWESLTSKGKLGANFAEAGANYTFAPLFMSNGLHLYGENGEDPKGTDFNTEPGVQVMQWIADQKNNSGVVQTNAETLASLQSGKIDAFLSGPWSKNDVIKAIGDDMAVAPYPTVDFGNGPVQQKAFMGVKLFAVNQQTAAPLAAMALADYVSNEAAQLAVFESNGIVPSNKAAQESDAVKADAVSTAVVEMTQPTHTVVMPKIPEIVSFWPAMDAVINDTYKGKIKPADFQSKLDKLINDVGTPAE